MKTREIKKAIVWMGTRVAFFYTALFLVSMFFVDYNDVQERYRIATINRLRPDFGYLIGYIQGKQPLDKGEMRRYARYLERVLQIVPNHYGAYGILGVCYYHQGDMNKAIKAYKRAKELNPDFFWYYHNIGGIYYEMGQYDKAVAEFKMAVKLVPNETIKGVLTSKIYQQIIFTTGTGSEIEEFMKTNLQEGYKNIFLALLESLYSEKEYLQVFSYAKHATDILFDKEALFYYYAGIAMHGLGDYKNAVYLFYQSIELDPDYWEVYEALARTLEAMGSKEINKTIIQKAAYAKRFDPQTIRERLKLEQTIF